MFRHAPEDAQESTVHGLPSSQLLQTLPTVPQAAIVFPGMHVSPSRHPVQHDPPVHLPVVVAALQAVLFGRLTCPEHLLLTQSAFVHELPSSAQTMTGSPLFSKVPQPSSIPPHWAPSC